MGLTECIAKAKARIKAQVTREINLADAGTGAIALSAGFGVMMGIMPIWGFQIAATIAIAQLLGLNKVIALLCTNISLPPMTPFVLYYSHSIGCAIYGVENSIDIEKVSIEMMGENMAAYAIGAVVLALICGAAGATICWVVVWAYRKRRDNNIIE